MKAVLFYVHYFIAFGYFLLGTGNIFKMPGNRE